MFSKFVWRRRHAQTCTYLENENRPEVRQFHLRAVAAVVVARDENGSKAKEEKKNYWKFKKKVEYSKYSFVLQHNRTSKLIVCFFFPISYREVLGSRRD